MNAGLKFHPLADIFPLMEGAEFEALVADIRTNGLRERIKLLGGEVLDGRNRYRACIAAGVKPVFEHLPFVDPVVYVISANIHRRSPPPKRRAEAHTRPARRLPAEEACAMSGARHRRRPEDVIQRAVFQHLRARGAPGVFAFHPANGGYRKPVEATIMKGLGVVAGVPDVIAIHEGRCFALELKAEGGRATPKQLAAAAAMEAAGAFTAIAEGLDRALAILEAWGLLRGRA